MGYTEVQLRYGEPQDDAQEDSEGDDPENDPDDDEVTRTAADVQVLVVLGGDGRAVLGVPHGQLRGRAVLSEDDSRPGRSRASQDRPPRRQHVHRAVEGLVV